MSKSKKNPNRRLRTIAMMWALLAGVCAQVKADGELLYNGIRLPNEWPPRVSVTREPMTVPYLQMPPKVIPIDVGRQLFVDDFLIEQTTLQRIFHAAEYHPANPVLQPDRPWEQTPPDSEDQGKPSGAWVFSDGVWCDPADKLLKMWYCGGFISSTCLATSHDGIRWDKPSLALEPGSNIVVRHRRDSNIVWLDYNETDAQRRYKMFSVEAYAGQGNRIRLRFSPDGVSWSKPAAISPPGGDRTTVFYNPFRKVWVASLRSTVNYGVGRCRQYSESPDAIALVEKLPGVVAWVGADRLDPPRFDAGFKPELYTLDAVGYESLLLGAFSIYHGVAPDGTKKNDVVLGFSRDGFHWDRPSREAFLPNSDHSSDWNWGYMHSAGGVCLVMGDKLYFYACGRSPVPGGVTGLEKGARVYRTGLAILRRDGFASMNAGETAGTLTTRSVKFVGKYLFVNVAASEGAIQAEILDEKGQVIEPFSKANSLAATGDKTLLQLRWKGADDLSQLAGKPVRFRFYLRSGSLYSFWVSPEASGASHGFVAAGGPGFLGPIDTVGVDAYKAAVALSSKP